MPLPLDDPRWSELTTAYRMPSGDVLDWLREAYAEGMTSESLGDLINEVQHQGDSSQAMYALVPHLIELAITAEASIAHDMAIHAGMIHVTASTLGEIPCPEFLREDFDASASKIRDFLLSSFPAAPSFDDLKYCFAALAGVVGHARFGRLIDGFDFHEGLFHHASLDEPFAEDA